MEEKEINANRSAAKDLEEECARDETRWHQNNAKNVLASALESRLKPCNIREPTSGQEYHSWTDPHATLTCTLTCILALTLDLNQQVCTSYKELYNVRIKSLTNESEKMRKIQKEVKLMYEPAKEQRAMLADCQRLLQCKRHCIRLAATDGKEPNDISSSYNPRPQGFSVENHLVL